MHSIADFHKFEWLKEQVEFMLAPSSAAGGAGVE
jgi:hypothetical protein